MSADDDTDCPAHHWKLLGATLNLDGATLDYRCLRCEALMITTPDGRPPERAPR